MSTHTGLLCIVCIALLWKIVHRLPFEINTSTSIKQNIYVLWFGFAGIHLRKRSGIYEHFKITFFIPIWCISIRQQIH